MKPRRCARTAYRYRVPRRRRTLADRIAELPSPTVDSDFIAPTELRQMADLIRRSPLMPRQARIFAQSYWDETRWRRRATWLWNCWLLRDFRYLRARVIGR